MLALLAAFAAGGLAAVLLTRAARASTPSRLPRSARTPGGAPASYAAVGGDDVPGLTAEVVVAGLPVAVAVLDLADDVVLANETAQELGVVRDGRLQVGELRALVRQTRATGAPVEHDVELGPRLGRLPEAVRARVAPVGPRGDVVLLVEDIAESRRVDAVRRDFVANVSHELKTPVGAMSLLAEALVDAAADPDAVRRFAGRAQVEATRLGRLVQELIDLSRLQGADPLPEREPVSLDQVVSEALDRCRTAAGAKGIELVRGGDRGVVVAGSEKQLVTALGNLVDNAVAYSPERTRVAVAVRRQAETVELSVTDQGIGIAEKDLERVFERFYRVDPARSRATGGTGLGLAIVKHVATNHGGEVGVWSVEGSGSTFTLTLPAARAVAHPAPHTAPAEESA